LSNCPRNDWYIISYKKYFSFLQTYNFKRNCQKEIMQKLFFNYLFVLNIIFLYQTIGLQKKKMIYGHICTYFYIIIIIYIYINVFTWKIFYRVLTLNLCTYIFTFFIHTVNYTCFCYLQYHYNISYELQMIRNWTF